MKRLLSLFILALALNVTAWAETVVNPQAVVDLVNRVCGDGASARFTFTLDTAFNGGAEAFRLGGTDNAVTIEANTIPALTTGLNWYLNHEAHVNISWNNLTETPSAYPAPVDKSVHAAKGQYRYYLNYCTFSYSMSFWNEERWMREIDWMALHGVNLPLQIVGIDAVWYYMLREQFGFTHEQASSFVAGPAFQGWWLMNNLTGHGGNNPEWWYQRQAELGRKITDRMRGLGMSPCLPGYVGMAPQKYVNDTGVTSYTGTWCGFATPILIAPGAAYTKIAAQYYAYINKVFDFMPQAFSIDPCHERGIPSGMDYAAACNAARAAMNAASPGALWVAQEWQTNADQARINALPVENTLLLDLSSERLTYKGRYGSRQYLFCMLHNYGGNVGMYGCMQRMLSEYKSHLSTGVSGSQGRLSGVGATPEGIETNPMLYDLLFELPWLSSVPDPASWLADYTVARYGVDDADAKAAWENLRTTVYDNTNANQQGCREPVFCARPNLSGNGASSWAGASYDWDKNKVIEAAFRLLAANASGTNYEYDVVDFARQAVTDYAHTLQMDMAKQSAKGARFAAQADGFLTLMDDIDRLLGSMPDFRMGKWAGAARDIAKESGIDVMNGGAWTANPSDANWLEANARMLVTTWGNNGAATNQGGLRDYGNREWQGLISDYYRPRWVRFFNDMKANGSCGVTAWQWMVQYELPYVYGKTIGSEMAVPSQPVYSDAASIAFPQTYSATPAGDPKTLATAIMAKYFGTLKNGKYYSPWLATDASDILIEVKRAEDFEAVFSSMTGGSSIVSYNLDLDDDGVFNDADETLIADWSTPKVNSVAVPARLTMSDGAIVIFKAVVGDDLPAPRMVSVSTKDPNAGSVSILGEEGTSVSSVKAVTVVATPASGYDFVFWADADGNMVSTKATYTYAQAESIELVAYFGHNYWKPVGQTSAALGETRENNAFLTSISYKAGSAGYKQIFSADAAPETSVYFLLKDVIIAHAGDLVKIKWTGLGGMVYCYLSAYYDSNGDGVFDPAPFTTLGARNKQTAAVQNNEVSIQIPATAVGLKRVRLRFDGAWHTAWDASLNAFPANADTNRPVYDIYLYVVNEGGGEVEPVWSPVTETGGKGGNDEEGKPHDAGAWLTTLSIDGVEVYSNATADPVHTIIDATADLRLTAGETYTVAWTANDQMKWARLTAYLDTNADGVFTEATASSRNDCLGVLGGYRPSSTLGNAFMPESRFAFTVPADAKLGTTNLRLRFDDAWQLPTGAASSVPDLGDGTDLQQPMLSTSRSSRNVYDVHLTVIKPDCISRPDGQAAGGSGIYDLSGRRISAPAAGLYIIDGRKVVR